MQGIPPECQENNSNSKIPLEEYKSKITFLNPDRITVIKIKVDNCVIRDKKTLRCDYALIPSSDIEVYIELKGSDLNHAFKQIESTIRGLSDNPTKLKKVCFIIVTSIPPTPISRIQNQKKHFKKIFNADLHVQKTPYEYKLRDLYV